MIKSHIKLGAWNLAHLLLKLETMSDFKFTTPDFAGSPVQFVKEAREELKKVVWPNQQTVINLTIAVIIASIALATLLGGLDLSFTKLLSFII